MLSCPSLPAAETDCEVAIWAIDMGGFVVLEGDRRRIRDIADLPVLPGPMWNPRAESKTDYNDSAGYLAGLTTLK